MICGQPSRQRSARLDHVLEYCLRTVSRLF
jgi:hypothetical protein